MCAGRSEVGGGNGGRRAPVAIQIKVGSLEKPRTRARDARSQRLHQDRARPRSGHSQLSNRTITPNAITLPPNAPAAPQPISRGANTTP